MPFVPASKAREIALDDVAGHLTDAWAQLQSSSSRTSAEIAKKWAEIRAQLTLVLPNP